MNFTKPSVYFLRCGANFRVSPIRMNLYGNDCRTINDHETKDIWQSNTIRFRSKLFLLLGLSHFLPPSALNYRRIEGVPQLHYNISIHLSTLEHDHQKKVISSFDKKRRSAAQFWTYSARIMCVLARPIYGPATGKCVTDNDDDVSADSHLKSHIKLVSDECEERALRSVVFCF